MNKMGLRLAIHIGFLSLFSPTLLRIEQFDYGRTMPCAGVENMGEL